MNRHVLLERALGLTGVTLFSLACTRAPVGTPITATPTLASDTILAMYPIWVLDYLCKSNAYYSQNPLQGKTVRFETPIDINPNGIPQALNAIRNYEAMTGGAVTFRIVKSDPIVGITFVEGDAIDRDGAPGCGHVSNGRDPESGFTFNVTNEGVLNSLLYVHLGSSRCSDVCDGFQPCSIAEHELGHALGLGEHFPGFTGIEGLSIELLVTVMALYRVPPGTEMSRLCMTHEIWSCSYQHPIIESTQQQVLTWRNQPLGRIPGLACYDIFGKSARLGTKKRTGLVAGPLPIQT